MLEFVCQGDMLFFPHPTERQKMWPSMTQPVFLCFSVVKIRIGENVIVDGMTRITAQKKKRKVFKAPAAWGRSEQKQPRLYLQQGGSCDCRALDDPQNDGESFLVMGRRDASGKDVVGYFQLYDRRNKHLRRALR